MNSHELLNISPFPNMSGINLSLSLSTSDSDDSDDSDNTSNFPIHFIMEFFLDDSIENLHAKLVQQRSEQSSSSSGSGSVSCTGSGSSTNSSSPRVIERDGDEGDHRLMRPPSLHSKFFSSLKQVEKRLRVEEPADSVTSTSTASKVPETNPTPTESLATPLYLHVDHPDNIDTNNTLQDSSEAPHGFFTSSPQQFLPTHQTPLQDLAKISDDTDDIQCLMQLLGLSDNQEGTQKRQKQKAVACGDSSCGFYEKIVGVKGPKCEKEVERMEGWIKHFLRNGNEPLRLAFLIMGKAAFENGDDCGYESLEFPSAIDEFLKIDPPKD